ncbi:unnamed protein product [Gongylonema pulchrum]|uniref:HELICc2 domain-containing protein n=1 Tax=Gongylonema pulchrum TaxID=637853 RepID=A0A183DTK5_9BILA|nr:unnamed protein product [Gongylonema pulchrum]
MIAIIHKAWRLDSDERDGLLSSGFSKEGSEDNTVAAFGAELQETKEIKIEKNDVATLLGLPVAASLHLLEETIDEFKERRVETAGQAGESFVDKGVHLQEFATFISTVYTDIHPSLRVLGNSSCTTKIATSSEGSNAHYFQLYVTEQGSVITLNYWCFSPSIAIGSTDVYMQGIGSVVVRACELVPQGVLVFFASYFVMNACLKLWQTEKPGSASLWESLSKYKTPFVEPKSKLELKMVMLQFKEKVKEGGGAVLFAVCRAKVFLFFFQKIFS